MTNGAHEVIGDPTRALALQMIADGLETPEGRRWLLSGCDAARVWCQLAGLPWSTVAARARERDGNANRRVA